ncbi:hypothetical protein CEXT_424691 [Caerostris extrusa]|uniref:Uncharacterized protein n=1 Tax=Caerostris extrusa TaxID=172846 RepID=A0AAV4V532_CAEEX|nr:hypothetical protein CEXT_424691 [Caerostris extrusa]
MPPWKNPQSPNESANNAIWSRVTKTVFVSIQTLIFGGFDAVSCFNVGNITKCHILTKTGIPPGYHSLTVTINCHSVTITLTVTIYSVLKPRSILSTVRVNYQNTKKNSRKKKKKIQKEN